MNSSPKDSAALTCCQLVISSLFQVDATEENVYYEMKRNLSKQTKKTILCAKFSSC
jgi:hypothetical protein